MINLTITDKFIDRAPKLSDKICFMIRRKISDQERRFIKEKKFKKYYLPSLTEQQSKEYFDKFSKFWDGLIDDFDKYHVFWRNGLSSKMQEWDDSVGYWTLVLYTLEQAGKTADIDLMIVVESLEEADILQLWAQKAGWTVQSTLLKGRRIKRIVQELDNLARFFLIVYTCFKKKSLAPKNEIIPGLHDEAVLIVSQFYKHSFKPSGEYIDPFFGSLHKDFIKSGKNCFILADSIDFLDKATRRTIETMEEKNTLDFFTIYSVLSVTELIGILWNVFIFRLRIGFCRFDGCDISPLVRWHARRFKFHFNFNSAVFHKAVRKATKLNQFDKMLVVFEDNVHERGAIQGFREYSRKAVHGYSHAVIYPLNLKLHLTPKEKVVKPEADHYISCGPYAGELLERMGNRDHAQIVEGCSLRSIPVSGEQGRVGRKDKTVLVALDGFYSVFQQMDWLIENKDVFNGYKVIVRAHPNVSYNYIFKRCVFEFPNNFEISKMDLKEDFQRASCVIYRQASVGLQAILNGIPAIHTMIDLPLSADPIEELHDLKWVVRNGKEMSEALKEIEALDYQKQKSAVENAVRFTERYFAPVTEDRLKAFLG